MILIKKGQPSWYNGGAGTGEHEGLPVVTEQSTYSTANGLLQQKVA